MVNKKPASFEAGQVFLFAGERRSANSNSVENERQNGDDDCDPKYDLCRFHGGTCYSAKAQKAGDYSDDKKYDGPM